MSCLIMNLEPLAALANAVEARLNCGFDYWGFDVPDSLPQALNDCQTSGCFCADDIYSKLYALNVRAYNCRYKNHEEPADETAPSFDGNRYVIHHGPTYREHGFAVCPWHFHLARILDFWLYQTGEEATRKDPLRLAMKEFQYCLYSFIIRNSAQYHIGRWGDLPIPEAAPTGRISPEETNPDHLLWNMLKTHVGHNVSIVTYGNPDAPADVCLECKDCGCVILDAEIYTISEREDLK